MEWANTKACKVVICCVCTSDKLPVDIWQVDNLIRLLAYVWERLCVNTLETFRCFQLKLPTLGHPYTFNLSWTLLSLSACQNPQQCQVQRCPVCTKGPSKLHSKLYHHLENWPGQNQWCIQWVVSPNCLRNLEFYAEIIMRSWIWNKIGFNKPTGVAEQLNCDCWGCVPYDRAIKIT